MQLPHYINGQKIAADSPLTSINPSDTSDIVASFPDGDSAEVDAAVAAARAAFPAWSSASPEVRADLLDKVGATILARATELGELLAREEGKMRAEGIGEAMRAGRIFRYFGGEALRRHGFTLESTRPNVEVSTHREALGVVGLITPWNFPIAIPAWKAAPALAFGNTVVLKPANITAAIASALAGIIHDCGAPAGVFNMVLGRGRVGAHLAAHADVDAVSFTGSQSTGAQVAAADLDRAVAIALDGGFFQTGQRCTASSRVLVEEPIHDRFVETLAERAKALRVGAALDPATQIGPASSEAQLEQNLRYVGIATSSLKYSRHFRRNVRAGMVMVNLPTAGVDYHVPFGGTRGSSYGPREQGFAAVEFHTQVKTAYVGD